MKVTTVAAEDVSLPTVSMARFPGTAVPLVVIADVVVTEAPGAAPVAVSEIWQTAGKGIARPVERPAGVACPGVTVKVAVAPSSHDAEIVAFPCCAAASP